MDQDRKDEALKNHARLALLFREDRLAFEREKKKMIEDVINRTGDEARKERMRAFQASWDRKMKAAGSNHNRFVLAQTFFWAHVHEVLNPAIQKLNRVLNGESATQHHNNS